MHGLVFDLRIWSLAGSTSLLEWVRPMLRKESAPEGAGSVREHCRLWNFGSLHCQAHLRRSLMNKGLPFVSSHLCNRLLNHMSHKVEALVLGVKKEIPPTPLTHLPLLCCHGWNLIPFTYALALKCSAHIRVHLRSQLCLYTMYEDEMPTLIGLSRPHACYSDARFYTPADGQRNPSTVIRPRGILL